MDIEIWKGVDKRIQNPHEACRYIGELMENCDDKTFNGLITVDFTNSSSQIQGFLSTFCSECNKMFTLKAIYLEMNGFDINPDRWFFDLFGYKAFPQNDDSLDWLADWQSPDVPSITLTGLESIQKLYKQYRKENNHLSLDKRNKALDYNEELATLMVMAKFCKLIDESLDIQQLNVNVYATAHDFDIIYHKST